MDKAQISDPEGKIRPFAVQFNPNTMEYSINANRHSAKGTQGAPGENDGGSGNLQSDPTACGEQAVLSVRLFYHTFQSESLYYDVRIEIEKLRAFVRCRGNSEKENRKIKFTWGTFSHAGTLDSFSVTYQMFASDGTPVQAEASITIVGDDPDHAAMTDKRKDKERSMDMEWLFPQG